MKKQSCVSEIQNRILELQDEGYKEFHKKLIPEIEEETIVGVRTPALRALAKELAKREDIGLFLEALPHRYYEENNLHGFILEQEKDYDTLIKRLDAFLPYVDNWATCDMLRPKIFKKNRKRLILDIKRWLKSQHTYAVRFGMEMLMVHFLEEDFAEEYLELVASGCCEAYYINMMVAWYFATALAMQWESAVPYIENKRLNTFCHNKAIQKARESYRITPEQKEYLKTLKLTT